MKTLNLLIIFCLYCILSSGYTKRLDTYNCGYTGRDSLYIQTYTTDSGETYRLIKQNDSIPKIIYELTSQDESFIKYLNSNVESKNMQFDIFIIYNGTAEGNQFLFFNHITGCAYITVNCFSGFYPIRESVDFVTGELLLRNHYCKNSQSEDTLIIKNSNYIPYTNKYLIIKGKLSCLYPVL